LISLSHSGRTETKKEEKKKEKGREKACRFIEKEREDIRFLWKI
jgi:hypothetical protein